MLSKFCFEFWSKVFTPGGMYLSQTLSLQGFVCCLLLGWHSFWSISNQWFETHDSQKFIIWRRKLKAPGFTKVHHLQPTSDFQTSTQNEYIWLSCLHHEVGDPQITYAHLTYCCETSAPDLNSSCTSLKTTTTSSSILELIAEVLTSFLVKVLHICAKLTKKLQKSLERFLMVK